MTLERALVSLAIAVAALCAVAAIVVRVRPRAAAAQVDDGAPKRRLGAYAGSEACRSCHPSEFASWHRSYHRTMTTRPSAATVIAALPSTFEVGGTTTTLALDDAQHVVAEDARTHERTPVVLATGSHHYQAFWTRGARPGEMRLLPFVYLASDRRFAPRAAAFLTPDDAPPNDLAWSASCIQCHAVAGRPRRDDEGTRFDTDAAELGIACEACHGPGQAHAESHRSPLERELTRARGAADPTIVDPAKLDATRASSVCAQCHSLSFPRDEAAFWEEGSFGPRPDRPWDTRELLTYEGLGDARDPRAPRIDAPRESLFWRDGTIRVGGREANAHFLSPCFTGGRDRRQAACTSCHSMHASEPDDQLARGKEGDGACTQCHADHDREAHTHHAATSAGSRCVGCHMPKTTFALLGAIRSHRIESPSVPRAVAAGRIPACNLCHLDRTLAWTDEKLATWYGRPRTTLPHEEGAAAVRWLVAGDAAQRALAAAHFGMDEARAASGHDWEAPLLAELLDDPYAAVRYVAFHSLRSLPGFADLAYDFVAPREERRRVQDEARRRAASSKGLRIPPALVRELASQRDDRAITIAE